MALIETMISGPSCPPPRWGTQRTTSRPTHGAKAAAVAAQLGRPFLPWQQQVADTALEIDPATGKLAYRTVIVTVPRQSGKTTALLFTVMVLRCLAFGPRQQVVYTAQDRNSAREKFEEEFVETLRAAPGFKEGRDFKVRLANGSERILFLRTRSTLKISATLSSSGHGRTLDMPAIDEAFEHRTTDVDQGFRVPMITRPEPQLWVMSTAGDDRSLYLEAKRNQGRQAVDEGRTSGLCYFEWSAPDDAALDDRSVWRATMPALGHTITEAAIEAELQEMAPADFRRAYYNLTQHRSDEDPSPITPDVWGRQQDRGATMAGRLCLGLAVAPDRSRATISAAGPRPGGGWLIEVVESRAGTTWVPAQLAAIRSRNPDVAAVALSPGGPAGALLADIEATGIPVIKLGPRDEGQATGALLSHLDDGDVWHMGQPELDDAVAGARTKQLGDLVVWDRRASANYVGPLEAGTLAFGGLFRLPDEPEDNTSVYEDRGFVEW